MAPSASMDHCSLSLHLYGFNLTSSYADQRNEAVTVATSIVMLLLAALFFNLNLFSAFSDISAFLKPSVRLFLSSGLSLFLPVMSYLFSEAKQTGGQTAELSPRARTILTWMLLVELLRKKAEAILSTGGMQAYSGTIERASRIAWLGYLVFYNIRGVDKKAFYGTLWVLAAAKLVQRFVTSELAQRSFAYGRNPQLVASYMAQMLQLQEHQEVGQEPTDQLLKRCKYVVMGEEELEKEAGKDGYHLKLAAEDDDDDEGDMVTVGKIWKLAESDELLQSDPRLKRLCLSFALYKLLRRRLEDFPITGTEARNCHDLIFKGLCGGQQEGADATNAAVALFQVFNDEVQFLCEYYHSVLPVVLATPFFFLVNYIMFPVVVGALCVLTIILGSHGDVAYAFSSIRGVSSTTMGVMGITTCLLRKMTSTSSTNNSPTDLFSAVDLSITVLLALSFAYEQAWEFLVFIFSNWFMVSLLCSYASCSSSSSSQMTMRRWLIRAILWARDMLSQPNVCLKQFSVLRRFKLLAKTKAVPREAKKAIMERLMVTAPLSNGRSALMLEEHRRWLQSDELSWAFGDVDDSAGVADVMLVWHIATAMLEAWHPLPKHTKPGPSRKVATVLSGYCAYLVAFHPELLPDDRDGTERVYKDTMAELKKEMGYSFLRYYFSPQAHPYCDRLMEIAAGLRPATTTVLRKGAKLGKELIDRYKGAAAAAAATDEVATPEERVWKLLADVWTEVLVYAAPTDSELHVKAHREALAQGGEFITILWAMATHTGIARGVTPPPACV